MAVMHAQQYQSYKQTEIETASPGKLLLLLYDSAINRLKRARERMKERDREEAHQLLVKVQEIVVELMLALDWNAGSDLAPRLHALYDFMYRRLVDANVQQDPEIVDEVLQLLGTLQEGWREAYKQMAASGEQTGPAAGPRPQINVQG